MQRKAAASADEPKLGRNAQNLTATHWTTIEATYCGRRRIIEPSFSP